MNYLRPPRGEFSEHSLTLSNKIGYINVFWSMAYKTGTSTIKKVEITPIIKL